MLAHHTEARLGGGYVLPGQREIFKTHSAGDHNCDEQKEGPVNETKNKVRERQKEALEKER